MFYMVVNVYTKSLFGLDNFYVRVWFDLGGKLYWNTFFIFDVSFVKKSYKFDKIEYKLQMNY